MSQTEGWGEGELGSIVSGVCWLTLLVAIMGITPGLLKWLLLEYSRVVTEQ